MQELLTYLLKSSGLITAFYLAYYFLLRKETFFRTNRWFLLTGLVTSVALPLFFIKKIVVIETTRTISTSLPQIIPNDIETSEVVEKSFEIDWFQIGSYAYLFIAFLLLFKVVFNLFSLYRVLHNKQVIKKEKLQFIDVNENLSPFSFFNYIVFNSSLYSESELQSILLHEKIHSAQKHSLDVLLTNLFAVIFWFNPFTYLYKKAAIQNLEYIADSEAIAQIDDKKSYQMALLKVVSNQNCLPITNHFYQSLIKKRIVMLNKNQSNKRNSWKYTVIIPALIAFVILFQVKVIAQEKEVEKQEKKEAFAELISFTIDKNSSDAEIKENAENLKNKSGIEVKCSKIKRNAEGEIIAIKIDYKDQNGNKGNSYTNGDTPISPITIFKTKNSVGIRSDEPRDGRKTAITVEGSNENDTETVDYSTINEAAENPFEEGKNPLMIINGKEYSKNDIQNFNFSIGGSITMYNSEDAVKRFGAKGKDGAFVFNGPTKIGDQSEDLDADMPIPPTPPIAPTAPQIKINVAKFPNMPQPPKAPTSSPVTNKKEWDKFEKKMAEFEKKMEALQPEIDAYAEKMANVDEQMKPFEKEMEIFEKKMEVFEKQMEEYGKKVEAYQEQKHKKN